MKINTSFIKKVFGIAFLASLSIGCQNMDRPELGDYPKDANAPGGDLKFYVAFDGTTTNPLMNAVDSIRAKFPTDNPLESTDGISGKALLGGRPKLFVSYGKPNDWVANSQSFTISFWEKHAAPTQTEFVFSLLADNWAKSNLFCLFEGTSASPIVKFYVDEKGLDKWFEWIGREKVPGLYDGEWHHLAFVYDGLTSGLTLYKDGLAFATKKWTNHGNIKINDSNTLGFRIGGAGDPSQGWMNSWSGGIDQFRMYGKALSIAEINDLFAGKK